MTYCNPYDVLNDGSCRTEPAFEDWAPNWDPGIRDWLFTDGDPEPYLYNSSMTFGLNADKTGTVDIVRGDDDSTASGGFSLNIDDVTRPEISFTGGAYTLHMSNFDDVCSNYTTDLHIVELTPYVLQIATMRTNAEGEWWLIWSFIATDVRDGEVAVPQPAKEAKGVEPAAVQPIDDLDLATTLFSEETKDYGTILASSMTFVFDRYQPYGYFWWNGAANNGKGRWEESAEEDYGATDAYPKVTSDVRDFELTLTRTKSSYYPYSYSEGASGVSGRMTITGDTLKFKSWSEEVLPFFTSKKVSIESDEIIVVKSDYEENEFFFAVPIKTDADGNVIKYAYAKLRHKTATDGPVEVSVEQSKVLWNFGDTGGKAIRVSLLNSYNSSDDPAVSAYDLMLKKGQTMTIKFSITSGVTWNADAKPKAMIRHNIDGLGTGSSWTNFDEGDAVEINKTGETTITLTNNTGSKVDFSSACLMILLQIDSNYTTAHDLCEITLDADGDPVITGNVSISIE